MARINPYLDQDEETSGGGGGVTPTQVKDYDQVEMLSADTKKSGTIYIGTDGKLWTWNGTAYVASGTSDDSTMIPISRGDNTQNVAPSDAELQGLSKSKNIFAVVNLIGGGKEYWKYVTSWSRVIFLQRTTRNRTITATTQIENVPPTTSQFPSPIGGDVCIKQHVDAQKRTVTFVERFIRSGTSWVRTSIYYNNSPRWTNISGGSGFVIPSTDRSTHYLVDCGTDNYNLSLPRVADSANTRITIKAKVLATGKNLRVLPNNGVNIDGATTYQIRNVNESITMICDGTNWYIASDKKNVPDLEGGEVTILRSSESQGNAPTATETGRLPRAGDRVVIKLGRSGRWEGWLYGSTWTRYERLADIATVLIKDDQDDDMIINQKETSADQYKGSNIIYTVQPPTGKRVSSIRGTYGKVISKERNEVALFIPLTYTTAIIEVKLSFEDIPSSSTTSTLNHLPQFSNATGGIKDTEIEVLNNKTIVTKGIASVHGDGDFVVSLTCGANRKNNGHTGCAVIALPTSRDNMFTFEIKISEYIVGKSATIFVHGHQLSNTVFDRCSVHTSGDLQFKKVRYATKGGMGYIILGEDTDTHDYFQVVVVKAVSSHNGHNQMFRDMAVTFESDTSTWTDSKVVEFDVSKDRIALSNVITYQNSWNGIGGEWLPYIQKDKDGIVHIEGLISGGNKNTIVGTLPVGWRPEQTVLFHAPSQSETETRIDIATNGEILVRDGSRTNGWWTAIRVSYKAS